MLHRRGFIIGTSATITLAALPVRAVETGYLHVILFNFKDGVPPEKKEEVLAEIRNQAKLPGITSLFMAPNILKKSSGSPYEWVIMVDYATEEDSKAFQRSAAHSNSVASNFTPYREGLVFCDLVRKFPSEITNTNGNKIRRVLMFNFKDGVSAAERSHMISGLESMGSLPQIKRILVGKNAYKHTTESPCEWMVLLECATQADIEAFQSSAAQQAFDRDVFTPAVTDLIVADVKL